MASSSSSHLIPSRSSFKSWNYEVFVSFRGKDTRKTFVGHLYTSLVQQGIHTYIDEEIISRGESIGPSSLLKAIGESRIAVIVFSENYADSTWCLDELAYIMECRSTRGQIVMPVFYHVDPSDVRNQKGKYGKAFRKHESNNNQKVELWKNALRAAGNIIGWVTKDYANGHEACIKDIVGSISRMLYPRKSKVSIGIDTRLQDLKSKLETGSSGAVRIAGIWGVGGGGKTTLAYAAYTQMYVDFEGYCFLRNIREESRKHGLKMLQKNMLSTVLKTEVAVQSVEEGRSIIKVRLHNKKVLVVLDDVDDVNQIKALAGSHDWFGKGSRIIITTRNEHVLTSKADLMYEVSLLSHDDAMKLFRAHGYREAKPVDDYEILSERVVSYAGGLPLALEVLGSFLYDKDKDEWMSALAKLKDIPDHNVMERLKISYDGLNHDEKQLFLDIACFFRNMRIEKAMTVLQACTLYPFIGLRVLVQNSLISESNGIFVMHDLIEEMARHIVREEDPKNPEKHSRDWKSEDLLYICAMDVTKVLSEKVDSYAGGLPLVLKVLGKFPNDKDKDEWKSALTKLKDIPDPDVMVILKISYDGLDSDGKYLFLVIVLFHRERTPIDDATKVPDAVNTDMYSSTSTTMPKELTIREKVIKEHGRAVVSLEIILHINEALQKSHRPRLKDELCVYERLHGDLKKHGDYICKSILYVCNLLRSKDPNLFKKTSPKIIAKAIMDNFPKSDMLEELKLLDVGFLTFRLNSYWIAKRIHENLKYGIVAWAPITLAERVIVDFPSQDIDAEMHADGVRSGYIRDMLVRMLEYCGVEVSGRMRNKQSLREVKKYFPEEEGVIRNKKLEPLFIVKEKASSKAQPNNVYEDLASLWCGAYVQNAQWIIYVTPVRQREHIMKCFTAARDFVNKDRTFMCYLGYQTSGDEQRKLALLWDAFEQVRDFYVEDGIALGYSSEAVFECTIKYAYLKNQTYSGCTFEIKEMLDEKGNTFLHLLQTRDIIRSLKNSRPIRMSYMLYGGEHALGLQLLQVTEIIQESILSVRPHWLCEYLFNLSKNFISYIEEGELKHINFLLCEATEVVMEKCFDLLGIGPGFSKGLPSYLKQQSGNKFAIRDHYISLRVDSPKPSSRFELFSMYIEVPHSNCEKSNLFGRITVSDASGLRSDAWCDVDEKGCGHVAYFDHDWHDSIVIKGSSFLSFDDPASRHSVALSSLSIKIGVHLWVTSKEKDACYQLCDVTDEEIKLSGFWSGNQSIEHSTFYAEGVNGSVSLYYFLLKKVVDTSIRLEYEPVNSHPKVHGRILAYYGGDALDSCVGFDKKLYKAVIFEMVPTKLEEKSNLPLKKSALAVPTNGILVFEATFKDADSGEILVDEKIEYHEKDEGKDSKWIINGKTCCFTLTVDWIRGENCS